jgi:ABC-type dipeptide/oligopeptide/nickel transport system permease component
LIPVRVLLVTFLLTLLAFAVSLLLGILALVIAARWQGVHPNMTAAYRHVALPTAVTVGAIVLIASGAVEVRHYRQTKGPGRDRADKLSIIAAWMSSCRA